MKKYVVNVYYEGCIAYEVEAENKQDADDIADRLFANEASEKIKAKVGKYRMIPVEIED